MQHLWKKSIQKYIDDAIQRFHPDGKTYYDKSLDGSSE